MRKRIKIDLWKTYINIWICDDITELNDMFKDLDMHKMDSAATFTRNTLNIGFAKGKITPGLIAHEAKHAVNMIFDAKGQELDLRNDEAECYLLGFIVEKIHKIIGNL